MKKISALLMAGVMAFSCAAPALADDVQPAQWENSAIIGTITEETQTSIHDDFYTYINKDWILSAQIPEGSLRTSSVDEIDLEVSEQVRSLLSGDTIEEHDAHQAQIFYKQYTDMDKRNEQGVAPMLPYLEQIKSISSLDELSAYLSEGNPLCGLSLYAVDVDLMDSQSYVVYIMPGILMLGDADMYKDESELATAQREAQIETLRALFEAYGYDSETANATINAAMDIENELAAVCYGTTEQSLPNFYQDLYYNPVTADELTALSPNFPIISILTPAIDKGADKFILTNPGWLSKINELYTDENLEKFKALLICQTALVGADSLDQNCIDINDAYLSAINGIEYHTVIENNAYNLTSSIFGMAIGRIYAENFCSEQTKQRISDLITDVVAVFRARLEKNDWLSEGTREKAIDKLDNLTIRAAYPDDWSIYSMDGLDIKDSDEGGSLFESLITILKWQKADSLNKIGASIDHSKWSMSPQTVNASYNPTDNSINICAAILNGVFYNESMSDEELYGSIGTVIAHEITHAFDTTGCNFDAQGNMTNWWTDEDLAAFNERTQKVIDYYSAIVGAPGMNINGDLTIGENVADLGAVSCMLDLAKDKSDFDYNLFFTSYAKMFRIKMSEATAKMYLASDPHSPGFARINVNVQQFNEFYTTYDIQPGDGMYLDPDARLSVW